MFLHKSLELQDRNYSHLWRLKKKKNSSKVWVPENGGQSAMVWRNVALAPEGEVVAKWSSYLSVGGMNEEDEQSVDISWLKRKEKANHE